MSQGFPSGSFFIKSKLNGRVLDVDSGSDKDGAHIIVYKQKSQDNKNQLWKVHNGALINVKSGKALDVKASKIEDGADIIQYEVQNNQLNQTWKYTGEGYIRTAADPHFVLDIKNAEDEDGARVILYKMKEGSVASNQLWECVPHH
ncbi:ricin B lectin domain-containing protein [Pilobolus umbonatus]|nr:ricin B lectin domain-containing protein [Pilobolus umbonatus]